jgi:hypothetical protein
MIDSKERRSATRTASQFPLRYQVIPVAENGYVNARVEDLSPEGLRFQCRDEVRARVGMLLELQLPDEQPVHFFGRAAWVRELPDHRGFEVGGRFEDQSTWGRKTVERFLQHDSISAGP